MTSKLAPLAIGTILFGSAVAAEIESAQLSGRVTEISDPASLWIGAIEVHHRGAYLLEERSSEALRFLRDAALGEEVQCKLTGERWQSYDGPLVGDCHVINAQGGGQIDLTAALIRNGYARACKVPDVTIAIWPPVYICE